MVSSWSNTKRSVSVPSKPAVGKELRRIENHLIYVRETCVRKVLEKQLKSILQKKRKNAEILEFQRFFCGGDKRDRTADLLNAIQALSQLSYTPDSGVIITQLF